MAAVNPPWACQGRTDHPAVLFRMMLAGLVSAPQAVGGTTPVGGVNPTFGNRLAIGGLASMNVSVDTGLVYMPNTTAWNGMYAGYNTASFNVSVPASSATQWRRDYIVAQVTDPGDNTANWNVFDVAGTFSSSAPGSLPSLPANSIPLAIVNVVPNMTVTNGGGTVQDARLWQPLPGPIITTSSAKPSLSSPNGTMWYETDTGLAGIILNGAYKYLVADGVPDSWHALSLLNGWTVTSATLAHYKFSRDGDFVDVVGALNGGAATSANIASLSAPYRPAHQVSWAAAATASVPAGNSPYMSMSSGGTLFVTGVTPGAGGLSIVITGRYPLGL